jgi:lysophospholipase L1-like esterase
MYESRMRQYQRQITSDIIARTGQNEPPIIAITQLGYVNDGHGAFTGQYARLASTRLHGKEQFRLVNSLYQYDFISDGLHLTCAGQNRRGAAVREQLSRSGLPAAGTAGSDRFRVELTNADTNQCPSIPT